MSFLSGPSEVKELLRLWKAELLVEEALSQSLSPVRPEVAQQEGRNYFKLPLESSKTQDFLLREAKDLRVSVGEEELPFLAYLAQEDKARKRYHLPLEHEVWVGFPALYYQDKKGAKLATLFRFPVAQILYPTLDSDSLREGALPGTYEISLNQEERTSRESPYFLDELFLTERLGLLDEEILELRKAAVAQHQGAWDLVSSLLRLLEGPGGDPLEDQDWNGFLDRLGRTLEQRREQGRIRLFPYGLAYELDQGQPTRNLQKDLEELLDEELYEKLSPQSPAHAYLYGGHQEETKPQTPLAQVDDKVLTPSQSQALSAILGRKFTVIGGPPGTGKTQVIKNLLAHRLVRFASSLNSVSDRAVGLWSVSLVTSTNNRAVDNVMNGLELPDLLPIQIRLGSRLVLQRQTLPALVEYAKRLEVADSAQGLRDFNRLTQELEEALEASSEQPSQELYLLARRVLDAYARANQIEVLRLVEGIAADIEAKRGLKGLKRPQAMELFFSLFPLVGSTLLSLRNSFEMNPESLGLLVIDEAGQCAPHYVLPALVLARQAVLLGDPRQLEPVARLRGQEIEGIRKARSIHLEPEKARFFSLCVEQPRSAQAIAQEACTEIWPLREHFRCRKEIIEVCCDLCGYDLELKRDSQSALGPALGYKVTEGPEQRYGGSWWNPLEVEAVMALLERFHAQGLGWGEMAVLTPFRGQLFFLNQALGRSRIPYHSGEGSEEEPKAVASGTVHRFQGGERPLVIFSQVITTGEPVFLNSRVNLLNVALSRAQEHFCYVGALGVLDKGPFTQVLKHHLLEKGRAWKH